jgi:hypothetical protein
LCAAPFPIRWNLPGLLRVVHQPAPIHTDEV